MVIRRAFRWALVGAMLTLAPAVLLTRTGLSGDGAGPQGPQTASSTSVPPCARGTMASYIGTSCSQEATVYHWLSYSCSSTPSSICEGLGPNGEKLTMAMDPNGPYTILMGETSLWNVTAGQSVDVVIKGTVYGAFRNNNWPHFARLAWQGGREVGAKALRMRGQTGDGSMEVITTVDCASSGNCTNSLNGVSDYLCDAAHQANCVEWDRIPGQLNATFNAATAANPYAMTIEIKLNGGTRGTATLFSVGTHLIPWRVGIGPHGRARERNQPPPNP
jgi:hypothetical protein